MRQNKKNSSMLFTGLILVLVCFCLSSVHRLYPKTNVTLYFAKYEDNLAYLVPEMQACYK